ncbi:MAG: hypothetical protein Q8R78_02900 [Candidatus Omnitrophota bacterium]|nr:hypothetical protein [Candidatus Omnitrophota bacterium]
MKCIGAVCTHRPRRASSGDLTAYLKQPLDAIASSYWAYRTGAVVQAQEHVAAATDASDVMAYYAATPHYL